MTELSTLKKIFLFKTIAVVGYSPKINRPSNFVSHYMEEKGYRIFPVNPRHKTIGNRRCYESLIHINQKIDIVNIFRRAEHILPIVQDAIDIEAKAIWMQDGIINKNAEEIAKKSHLIVVKNDCIMRQHLRFES
jgi:predicted CoA-binding protein